MMRRRTVQTSTMMGHDKSSRLLILGPSCSRDHRTNAASSPARIRLRIMVPNPWCNCIIASRGSSHISCLAAGESALMMDRSCASAVTCILRSISGDTHAASSLWARPECRWCQACQPMPQAGPVDPLSVVVVRFCSSACITSDTPAPPGPAPGATHPGVGGRRFYRPRGRASCGGQPRAVHAMAGPCSSPSSGTCTCARR